MSNNIDENSQAPYRVRHELKFRHINVNQIKQLSPSLLRIEFTGEDLADFVSEGFDDHMKVFFPDPKTGEFPKPYLSAEGLKFEDGITHITRDYTPRKFSNENQKLTIDFVIHDAGPATEWAQQAHIGDPLLIGGPRGSMIIPMVYEHYYLIGDETALPAIARRLEELPEDVEATIWIEVDSEIDQIELTSKAKINAHWLYRNGQKAGNSNLFLSALENLTIPENLFIWIATEAHVARKIRRVFINSYKINKEFIKAAGYWQSGSPNINKIIQDEL